MRRDEVCRRALTPLSEGGVGRSRRGLRGSPPSWRRRRAQVCFPCGNPCVLPTTRCALNCKRTRTLGGRKETRTASVTSATRACGASASTTPLGHYSVGTLLRRGAGEEVGGGRPIFKNLEAVRVGEGGGGGGHRPVRPRPGARLPDPGGRRASSVVPSGLCRRGPVVCGNLLVWYATRGRLGQPARGCCYASRHWLGCGLGVPWSGSDPVSWPARILRALPYSGPQVRRCRRARLGVLAGTLDFRC